MRTAVKFLLSNNGTGDLRPTCRDPGVMQSRGIEINLVFRNLMAAARRADFVPGPEEKSQMSRSGFIFFAEDFACVSLRLDLSTVRSLKSLGVVHPACS